MPGSFVAKSSSVVMQNESILSTLGWKPLYQIGYFSQWGGKIK